MGDIDVAAHLGAIGEAFAQAQAAAAAAQAERDAMVAEAAAQVSALAAQVAAQRQQIDELRAEIARLTAAPPAPQPDPPGPPVPPPTTDPGSDAAVRYRCQTRDLFQQVAVSHIAGRLPGQPDLLVETCGPTALAVDKAIGWLWASKGGDYGPATATVSANLYPRGSAGGWYAIDALGALQQALAEGRAWAFYLGCNTSRRMHGRKGAHPPRLVLSMADGTEQTVACSVTCSASATKPSQLVAEQLMPAFVQFVRPAQDPAPADITAARIEFYVDQHNGLLGAAAITLHLLTPDISLPAVVTGGIAEQYPGDIGIGSDPRVLWHHDYADDRPESDFIFRQPGLPSHETHIEAARNYSPDVWNLSWPADHDRYPYRGAGRWLGAGPNVSIVRSDYTGYGYKPFGPGRGALRVHLPREARAVEGGLVGNAGTLGCAMEMPLPVPRIGRQQTMSVRYKFRWGVPDGEPHELPLDAILAVWQQQREDGTFYDPNFLSFGGKCGITFSHTTKAGGRSGSSGGGGGWQNRLLWGRFPTGAKGPQAHGISCGFHLFDYFGRNSPTGKSALGSKLPWTAGRVGGVLYPNTTYEIEHRIKLNSVDKQGVLPDGSLHSINGVPQYWAEDGELTLFVDGMPVWHDTGLCFRSLPYRGMPATFDPAKSAVMYQIGDLGVRCIELNVFSGGVTPGACDMSLFYGDVVVSLGDYIGPMRGV